MTIQCRKCGYSIPITEAEYCPRCGSKIIIVGDLEKLRENVLHSIDRAWTLDTSPEGIAKTQEYIDVVIENLTTYLKALRSIEDYQKRRPRLFGKSKWTLNSKTLLVYFGILGKTLSAKKGKDLQNQTVIPAPDGCVRIWQKLNKLEELTDFFVNNYDLYLSSGNTLGILTAGKTIEKIVETYNEALSEIENVISKITSISE